MSWVESWRLVRAVTVLSFLAPAMVACSPAPKALLAVERTERGTARVLVASCPNYHAIDFSVFADWGDGKDIERWAVRNESMQGSLPSIELFVVPEGWSVDDAALSSFNGAEGYTANIYGAVFGRTLDGKVSFTPGQFERLKEGKVLVMDGVSGTKVISRSEFLKGDSDRCDL